MFELKRAVIHSFKKAAHTDVVEEIVKKNVVLKTDNPALIALAQGINGLIGKTGNSVVYGQFSNDGRQGPFPESFNKYTGHLLNEAQFIALTHLAMDQLIEQAAKQVLSTGGHVLCALYESQGMQFFLVASMKERGGIQLDKNYVPTAIQEIDLNKVQQAARININDYVYITQQLPKEQAQLEEVAQIKDALEEQRDTTYLCFISRGRDSQASDYFIYALGCAKGVASGRATKNAIDTVAKFFQSKSELKGYGYKAKEAVIKYLEKQLAEEKPARLDAICHAATQHVPAELVEHLEGLKDFLNDEKNRVPDEFSVHAKGLKEKTRIKSDASSWSVQFERGALGKSEVADVYYDEENKKLVLTNLPSDLIAVIEEEISSRNI
jgi:nucleoid-associated protein